MDCSDLPAGGATDYAKTWQPYVGLSLRSLLDDPTWLQHVKRAGYYVVHSPRLLPRRVRHYCERGWAVLAALLRPRWARKIRPQPLPQPAAGSPPRRPPRAA